MDWLEGLNGERSGVRGLLPATTRTVLLTTTRQPLVDAFLGGRNARTLRAYSADLESFRAFADARDLDEAARLLLDGGQGNANATALAYRTALVDRKLAPATINRRLASLRSLVTFARTLGLVPFDLEVRNVRAETLKDTRGPGRAGFKRLFGALVARDDAKGRRDRALLRLLYDLALRRGEVAALDLADLDLDAGTLAVLGKGRAAKIKLTLPEPTKQALAAWVTARGTDAGPLFTSLDRKKNGGRLTDRSIHRLVRKLGASVGITTRPHALRHAAITEALTLTGGDVRRVAQFSRHRSISTVLVYDDSRRDLGGEVAKLVAESA